MLLTSAALAAMVKKVPHVTWPVTVVSHVCHVAQFSANSDRVLAVLSLVSNLRDAVRSINPI
jgi:hypothetical protein